MIMSRSLVKQSLELFDEPHQETSKDIKNKIQLPKRKPGQFNQKFTKHLTAEKRFSGKNIDQIRKEHSKQKDRTEENLRKLNLLSKSKVSKEKTTLMFKRANRSREEPQVVEIKSEGTVFTEEDFAKFEREYVVD